MKIEADVYGEAATSTDAIASGEGGMEDLEDLLYEDLIELYMDQLNHGFRFNAKIREDHTWTEVPWDVAKDYILDKLNEFMFQYF